MIVFDLDGTLALGHKREHHLLKNPKDWDAYFSECKTDEPCFPIIQIALALKQAGNNIQLWSGRSGSVNQLTIEWLVDNNLDIFNAYRFRDPDDRTQDDILKKQWLDDHNKTWPDDPVTLVFEDRKRVVDMWRANGVVCCQVAPGDF